MLVSLRKLAPLLCALALGAAACGGDEKKSPEDVPPDAVALVGDQKILKAQVEDLMEQARRGYKAQKRDFPKPGTPDYDRLRDQAVGHLVQRAEFEQEAKEMGIEVTKKEVDKGVQDLVKQVAGGNEKKFQRALKQQGLTEKQVRDTVELQILQREIYNKVTGDVKVSDEQVEKYYEEHKKQFTQPSTRNVRHILIACSKPAECKKDEAKADELYTQLKNGADFAALAKKVSEDPGTKAQGGTYQAVKGQSAPEFDKVAFALDVGELSKPVKTQFGWHIIKAVSTVKAERATPLATVKDTIRNQLLQEKKNKAITKWVEDVKKKWEPKVVYAVGYQPATTETAATTQG